MVIIKISEIFWKEIELINSKRLAKCLSRKRSGKSVSSKCEDRFKIINDKTNDFLRCCINKYKPILVLKD